MNQLLKVYKNKKSISFEWNFLKWGYCNISIYGFTFLHQFLKRGYYWLESEKEFIFRFQFCIDNEPKFSWVTLELVNPYEARLFILWFKVWKKNNVKIILNLGWRTTKATRDFMSMDALGRMRMREKLEVQNKNNGGHTQWRNQQVSLKAI